MSSKRVGPGVVVIEYSGYNLTEPDGNADWSPDKDTEWDIGVTTSPGLVYVRATDDDQGGAIELWVELASAKETAPAQHAVARFPARLFYLAGVTLDSMRDLTVELPAAEVALTVSRERIAPPDQTTVDDIEVTERHTIKVFQHWT